MTEYFSPAPPRVLAHRGLALDVPENTLAAFTAARAVGATHLETDAHVTRDGHAVLWHDPTLERFDGDTVRIAELTLEQVRARSVDGHGIATLAEALDAFEGVPFNIDLKVGAAVDPVVEAIERANATDRVLLASFTEPAIARAVRTLPGVARGASRERMMQALLGIELGSERLVARALRGVDALQIPPTSAGLTLVSPKRLAALRRHVREIHVWTVNDPAEMVALLDAGIQGLVTDRADLAVPLVNVRR